jgi:putative mRNA 3-end processing factor
MNCDEALKVAKILNDGSVLAGTSVVCDGYSEDRTTAVFTHIHNDHISLFETALNKCDKILVTKPTWDMLVTLKGDALRYRDYFTALDFHSSFFNRFGDKITLYPSNHILGSCQVLIQSDDKRILYSGDFNFPDIEVVKCDILILDSTHGDPRFNLVYNKDSLCNRLVDLVQEEIEQGKPVLIKAHRGRMQEVMSLLDNKLISAVKYLADEKDIKLMQVYNKYGIPCMREIITTNSNPTANRIINYGINGGLPFIHFCPIGAHMEEEDYGVMTIRLSSDTKVFGGYAIREIGNNKYVLDLSDHASYENILNYVKATGAKCVITDNARTKNGLTLASAIEKHLQVPSCTCP